MNAHVFAVLVEAVIPVGGGVYLTLLGHRIVGKRPGVDFYYDERMNKVGGTLRIGGPCLIVWGIVMAVINLSP